MTWWAWWDVRWAWGVGGGSGVGGAAASTSLGPLFPFPLFFSRLFLTTLSYTPTRRAMCSAECWCQLGVWGCYARFTSFSVVLFHQAVNFSIQCKDIDTAVHPETCTSTSPLSAWHRFLVVLY